MHLVVKITTKRTLAWYIGTRFMSLIYFVLSATTDIHRSCNLAGNWTYRRYRSLSGLEDASACVLRRKMMNVPF